MRKLTCLLALPLCLSACASHFQRTDDQTCRSYGAEPGTQVYVQCRMLREAQRQAVISSMADDIKAAGAAFARPSPSPEPMMSPFYHP